jgi:hypothetical protein
MVAMAEGTGRWRWQKELGDGGDGRGNWAMVAMAEGTYWKMAMVAMAEGTGRW